MRYKVKVVIVETWFRDVERILRMGGRGDRQVVCILQCPYGDYEMDMDVMYINKMNICS